MVMDFYTVLIFTWTIVNLFCLSAKHLINHWGGVGEFIDTFRKQSLDASVRIWWVNPGNRQDSEGLKTQSGFIYKKVQTWLQCPLYGGDTRTTGQRDSAQWMNTWLRTGELMRNRLETPGETTWRSGLCGRRKMESKKNALKLGKN